MAALDNERKFGQANGAIERGELLHARLNSMSSSW